MPFIKNQVKLKNLLSCLEALYITQNYASDDFIETDGII